MSGYHWRLKPPIGTSIDRANPLARGLLAFFPFWEGQSPYIYDVVAGLPAVATSAAAWATYSGGRALSFPTTGAYAQTAALGSIYHAPYPMSLVIGMRLLGTPSSTAQCFALNDGASTWLLPAIALPTSSDWQINWANGATSASSISSIAATFNADVVAGYTVTTSSQTLYLNGTSAYALTNPISSPVYSGSTILNFGYYPSLAARNPNYAVYWAGYWNRALTPLEHQKIGSSWGGIWRIFRPPIRNISYFLAPQTHTIFPSPQTIPANHGGDITNALSGIGTSWSARVSRARHPPPSSSRLGALPERWLFRTAAIPATSRSQPLLFRSA
jgi:hypothetical protein